MIKHILKAVLLITFVTFLSVTVLEVDLFARAGGGKSSGTRGSRSYSSPSRPSPSPSRQEAAPSPVQPTPAQQPQGGGFLRGLGGGILGGLLGGMLFSSLGFGSYGSGLGGSGIGIFEILLILAGGFLLYKMFSKKREPAAGTYQSPYVQKDYQREGISDYSSSGQIGTLTQPTDDGISYIRQMDPSFDEGRFRDAALDIFFKIQGAWTNRDLSPVKGLLTDEMTGVLQSDIDTLIKEKRINRLENIAVRNVEMTEAWQESGQDFITVRYYANLLDYAVDTSTDMVVSGSRTEPVKFEEYWTFTRAVGNNPWRLSAITQV